MLSLYSEVCALHWFQSLQPWRSNWLVKGVLLEWTLSFVRVAPLSNCCKSFRFACFIELWFWKCCQAFEGISLDNLLNITLGSALYSSCSNRNCLICVFEYWNDMRKCTWLCRNLVKTFFYKHKPKNFNHFQLKTVLQNLKLRKKTWLDKCIQIMFNTWENFNINFFLYIEFFKLFTFPSCFTAFFQPYFTMVQFLITKSRKFIFLMWVIQLFLGIYFDFENLDTTFSARQKCTQLYHLFLWS